MNEYEKAIYENLEYLEYLSEKEHKEILFRILNKISEAIFETGRQIGYDELMKSEYGDV
jgi:hypothetical protein